MNVPKNLEFVVIAIGGYNAEEEALVRDFRALLETKVSGSDLQRYGHLIAAPMQTSIKRFTGPDAYTKANQECPGAQYISAWEEKPTGA